MTTLLRVPRSSRMFPPPDGTVPAICSRCASSVAARPDQLALVRDLDARLICDVCSSPRPERRPGGGQ